MTWRRFLQRCAIVATATAVGTLLLGWWVVPVIGAIRGFMPGRAQWRAWETAVGTGLGWLALLVWTEVQGPAAGLSGKVSAVFGLPAAGLLVGTLLFAILLAGSATAFAVALRKTDHA